jgi:hypothetical protein
MEVSNVSRAAHAHGIDQDSAPETNPVPNPVPNRITPAAPRWLAPPAVRTAVPHASHFRLHRHRLDSFCPVQHSAPGSRRSEGAW